MQNILKKFSFLIFLLLTLNSCNENDQKTTAYFTGRDKCISCHQKQYREFSGSDHDNSMAVASDQTVLADFNNTSFTYFGSTSQFYKRNGRFYVFTTGENGELKEYEIKYTFGIYPLQQYLAELPGGRLQCLPICWDTRPKNQGGQRWFHLYPDEQITSDNILHWTRVSQNWNYMCAECHSTNLKKNYKRETKSYNTRWSEINVSCEACHGPGSNHLEWADKYKKDSTYSENNLGLVFKTPRSLNNWKIDPTTGNAKLINSARSQIQVEMCARCHSHRSAITENYIHGQNLSETHMVSLLDENLYFPDGQIKEEVYVYGSFLQSKMYQAGVICSDCHNSHSGELIAEGNNLCFRCHYSPKYDSVNHHHHSKESQIKCIDCHMPVRTYMVVDDRHDHSFRIPRPDLSEKLNTPNTCNQCHIDKPIKWASQNFKKWYPERSKKKHFGEIFKSVQISDPNALKELQSLISDYQKPAIIRATAVSQLKNYPANLYQDFLQKLLIDSEILVRRAAIEELSGFSTEIRSNFLKPLLLDSSKTIRITAANSLSDMLTVSKSKAYSELKESQIINVDFPANLINMSNIALNQNQFAEAESFLKEAIEVEPLYIPPYINLADLYRIQNKEKQAIELLTDALKLSEDAALLHSLALAYIRSGEREKAHKYLKLAAINEPYNKTYIFTYILSLNNKGKTKDAIKELEKALVKYPYDLNFLQLILNLHEEIKDFKKTDYYRNKILDITKVLSNKNLDLNF